MDQTTRPYLYPYNANIDRTNHYSEYLTRTQSRHEQQLEDVRSGIKRTASAINLYRRLANAAPNEQHKREILHALEVRKAHFNQFTHLYMNLTGRQPEYQIEMDAFQNYKDGLHKAYELELEDFHEYQRCYSETEDRSFQNVFLWALQGEQENASRLYSLHEEDVRQLTDYGSEPFVVNINEMTKQNNTFRTALWTGDHLQVTLMSIDVGDDIGLEVHPHLDQFLRIEEGQGLVQMGDSKDELNFQAEVFDDFSILVPAGKWHNLTNTGNKPIKLYSIYAPPQHPFGTVHETKEIAMAAEEDHHH
ncbi:cupin domain-containing protein [Alkalihalobacillus sp. MEB130]|uniref:cupin domain-containing protein n=1 Tax=Alkalihalobacillus sp. MEB130 TaxID=2976704 RepID=UPI0028DFA1C0|nr:cupin domain-containing protein [Alkalihalobacillus sp. MEB130]MDT8862886.1 cupin domain-containing protein [Alkalihalobacillus sp. MEB130]